MYVAFKDLKEAISTAPILIPYDPRRETRVICDGSPTGLGGGLFQETKDGYQPVHFVSRTLTETENKYSQIEREALAVLFTTSRLKMYLLGANHFQIATDHKPLIPILNKPQAKLPPRIKRMVIKMQNLDFTAMYIPGKTNAMDYISRHPLPETANTGHDGHVKAVIGKDHAVVLEKIAAETQRDPQLKKVQQALVTGNWNKQDPDLAPFYELRAEIYMADGVMLRSDRIIPPESLKEKIITTAHRQGHLGITKTKEMIKQKYWFPSMNHRIESFVSECFSCQISTNTHHTEPAKMTELPPRQWEIVEVDFCGPFPNQEYVLVVTDQYPKYPEIEFVRSISMKSTREKMKKIFATHGVPKKVQTDNGAPFNSKEFEQFSAEEGFQH